MKKSLTFVFVLLLGMYSCTSDPHLNSGTLAEIFNRDSLPSSTFSIIGERDTIVQGVHGTKLCIRKNTFLDSHGRTVSGKVEVELKEALSMEDIVLGNLTTTSNGQILQSGGMIYINATSNGENISIAENNSIDVSVPSADSKDSMQLYTGIVDETSRQLNWVDPKPLTVRKFIPDTDTSFSFESMDSSQTSVVFSSEVTSDAPFKPGKIEPKSDTIITLDFDTSAYPELAEYRHVKFKLMDQKNFSADDSKRVWISVDLMRTGKPGIYTLIFGGFDNEKEISKRYTVSPVFASGEDYNQAMAVYEKKFVQYESAKNQVELQRVEDARLAKLEQERIEEEQELDRQKWEAEQKAEMQQRAEQQKNAMKLKAEQEKINMKRRAELQEITMKTRAEEAKFAEIRRKNELARVLAQKNNPFISDPQTNYVFAINKLGWANIDKLYHNPSTRQIDLLTEVKDQNTYDEIYVSLIIDKEMIYLPGYRKADSTYGFSHNDYEPTSLPVGATATVFATGYSEGKLYYYIQKFTISTSQKLTVELKETTKEALKGNCKTLL